MYRDNTKFLICLIVGVLLIGLLFVYMYKDNNSDNKDFREIVEYITVDTEEGWISASELLRALNEDDVVVANGENVKAVLNDLEKVAYYRIKMFQEDQQAVLDGAYHTKAAECIGDGYGSYDYMMRGLKDKIVDEREELILGRESTLDFDNLDYNILEN